MFSSCLCRLHGWRHSTCFSSHDGSVSITHIRALPPPTGLKCGQEHAESLSLEKLASIEAVMPLTPLPFHYRSVCDIQHICFFLFQVWVILKFDYKISCNNSFNNVSKLKNKSISPNECSMIPSQHKVTLAVSRGAEFLRA